jgi:3'(2'), 5'-bisphosphate nucleotidase
MEWDTAAGQAVVEAAGGRVLTLAGAPLHYNKENLLNPHFIVSGGDAGSLPPRAEVGRRPGR